MTGEDVCADDQENEWKTSRKKLRGLQILAQLLLRTTREDSLPLCHYPFNDYKRVLLLARHFFSLYLRDKNRPVVAIVIGTAIDIESRGLVIISLLS